MKKYSFGFILMEIAVMLVISIIPTVFVALFTDPEKNLTIPALIIFMFICVYTSYRTGQPHSISCCKEDDGKEIRNRLIVISRGLDSKWSSVLEGDMSWFEGFKSSPWCHEHHFYIDDRNKILDEIIAWQQSQCS